MKKSEKNTISTFFFVEGGKVLHKNFRVPNLEISCTHPVRTLTTALLEVAIGYASSTQLFQ